MPDPTTPNQPTTPTSAPALQLTPNGTPVVPASVPQLSPELITLLNTALAAMPPGAGRQILKQYWAIILSLVVPLLLTTWTSIKEILNGPAEVAAIRQEYADDHAAVEALEKKVEGLESKLDQVLWILRAKEGSTTGTSNRQ